jgi:hypothetical protein
MAYSGGVVGLISAFSSSVPRIIVNNIEIFKDMQFFHDVENSRNREQNALRIEKRGIDISNPNVQK